MRRVIPFIRFCSLFLYIFIKANFAVAYLILFVPKKKMEPAFFEYDASDLTWFEALLLSFCITLTPGTITVDLCREKRHFLIHSLDHRDPDRVMNVIKHQFKPAILRFTR